MSEPYSNIDHDSKNGSDSFAENLRKVPPALVFTEQLRFPKVESELLLGTLFKAFSSASFLEEILEFFISKAKYFFTGMHMFLQTPKSAFSLKKYGVFCP